MILSMQLQPAGFIYLLLAQNTKHIHMSQQDQRRTSQQNRKRQRVRSRTTDRLGTYHDDANERRVNLSRRDGSWKSACIDEGAGEDRTQARDSAQVPHLLDRVIRIWNDSGSAAAQQHQGRTQDLSPRVEPGVNAGLETDPTNYQD